MRCTWILALGVAFAGPAFAQSPTAATEAGAQELSRELASYLSQSAFDRKIVTVTPEAAGYRITFAPNAAIQPMLGAGAKVDVLPWSVMAARRADGNWDVSTSDPIGVSFDVTVEGARQKGDYQIEAGRFSGVFSPTLGAFLSGSGEYPGGTMTTSDPTSDVQATFGRTTYELAGKDVGGGAVDATTRQTLGELSEKVTVKQAGTEAPDAAMTFDVAAKNMVVDAALDGFKSRALLDLWAFAVTHADGEKAVADQETLRGLLSALLPVWTSFRGSYDFNTFALTSAFGGATMDKLSLAFEGDGVSTSSAFSYSVGFDGLSFQSPMMPAWAAGLVPEAMSLTFKVEGLDLDTPAKKAIADFDLSTPDVLPPATGEAITASFEANPPRLTLQPSRVKTRDAEVTFRGDFFAGAQPEMNMTVEATGIDKVISTLQGQAASDPSINEIVGGLQLAKGFAKALPDGRSQWIVATKADGSVTMNGNVIVPATPAVPEAGPAPTDDNAMPTEAPNDVPNEAPAEEPAQ